MCRARLKSYDHVSDTFQVIEIVLEQDHVKVTTFAHTFTILSITDNRNMKLNRSICTHIYDPVHY